MFLSAFTFARNADKFYYPLKASITSVLPIADEVIIALGDSEPGDKTDEIIAGINSPKLKIFKRPWDPALFANSRIFAHETQFALGQCKSQWCLYLQADEVLHEDDLPIITEACKKYADDLEVDGLLFDYVHFWGDYNHLLETHGLIRNEIRVIRNGIGCTSYKDAVSFRKGNNEKLNVVHIPARIFHYGYIRPPHVMGAKSIAHIEIHHGKGEATKNEKPIYDWGPLGGLEIFKGSHPAVMNEWLPKFNWSNALNFSKPKLFEKSPHKYLRTKYRILTWFENNFNNHKQIFGFQNYKLLKR